MLLILVCSLLLLSLPIDGIYQSKFSISSGGKIFQRQLNVQLLLVTTETSIVKCALQCNQRIACRTFDYNASSRRCRLFEADSTTGTIASSSSLSSAVGSMQILPSLYSSTHNQPCAKCAQTRYEVCSTNTSTCQCPPRTRWNGQICVLQLLANAPCTQSDACRSDLNLNCSFDCYNELQICAPVQMPGKCDVFRWIRSNDCGLNLRRYEWKFRCALWCYGRWGL